MTFVVRAGMLVQLFRVVLFVANAVADDPRGIRKVVKALPLAFLFPAPLHRRHRPGLDVRTLALELVAIAARGSLAGIPASVAT